MKKDRESVKRGLSVFFWAAALFFIGLFVSGCFGERVSEQQHPDTPALAPGVSFSGTSGFAKRLMERRPIVDRTGAILCISKRDPQKGPVRIHPYGGLLDDVLGYVDRYGRGLEGLEYVYDGYLLSRGKEGAPREPLILSVDKNLQSLCKRNLHWQMKRLRSRAGTMIFMDVRTGHILAMTSLNDNTQVNKTGRPGRNLAASGLLNPWPLIVTLAEARLLDMNLKENESRKQAGTEEPDVALASNEKEEPFAAAKRWHWYRFKEDAGFWTRLASKELDGLLLSPDLLQNLISVGLGQKTGIDLPEERQGRLPSVLSANVTDVISSTASATPVQLLSAYTALLRNGSLPRPRIAMNVRNGHHAGSPKEQPLFRQETHKMLLALVGDENGPSIASYSPGRCKQGERCFDVVGLGFWPAKNPRISYISVLFGAKYTPAQRRGTLGKMALLARKGASALKGQYRYAGGFVRQNAMFRAENKAGAARMMPDLRGLSIRSALELAGRLGMRIRISGIGKVREQYPRPGSRISGKGECVLICGKGPA